MTDPRIVPGVSRAVPASRREANLARQRVHRSVSLRSPAVRSVDTTELVELLDRRKTVETRAELVVWRREWKQAAVRAVREASPTDAPADNAALADSEQSDAWHSGLPMGTVGKSGHAFDTEDDDDTGPPHPPQDGRLHWKETTPGSPVIHAAGPIGHVGTVVKAPSGHHWAVVGPKGEHLGSGVTETRQGAKRAVARHIPGVTK